MDPKEQAIELAVAECVAFGAAKRAEMAVFLDPQGNRVFAAAGQETHVEFNSEQLAKIDATPGGLLIHNHPRVKSHGASLSQPDILMATSHGIEVWAVTEEGGRYKTRGLLLDGQPLKQVAPHVLHAMEDSNVSRLNRIENKLDRFFYMQVMLGELTEAEANTVSGHLRNLAFQREGLLDYRYQAGPTMTKLTKRLLPRVALLA